MPYLFNLAYLALLLAVSPMLAYRAVRQGKYRVGWGEKLFGRVPVRSGERPCLWIHAVSVGEVLLLPDLVERLRRERPNVEFVITTTTSTGRDVAVEKFPDDTVCFCPLDFSWAVNEAMLRIRPSALILSELELWPNLISIMADAGVPVAIVNGRLGEKSFRGYSRLGFILKPIVRRLSLVAAQTEQYAEHFRRLGVLAERVQVTGSLKFDRATPDRSNPLIDELRQVFDLVKEEPVWVAGSTKDPEEGMILGAYRNLLDEYPNLKLILVPRHRERFDEVASLIASKGFGLIRRSNLKSGAGGVSPPHLEARPIVASPVTATADDGDATGLNPCKEQADSSLRGRHAPGTPQETSLPNTSPQRKQGIPLEGSQDVLESCPANPSLARRASGSGPCVRLLDTLGELSACWALADIAFVGGSMPGTGRGGQNMIEPAAYGVPLILGPNTQNFRDVVEQLKMADAVEFATDETELRERVAEVLCDRESASERGQRAAQVVAKGRGATERTVTLVTNLIRPINKQRLAA
ncbi:3-deoxy-D-manno-octulosonic acid transferase [Stratiformator vulcanicus]|uniref:3-deoxy-D-manno-octulosonic acid transferase n=1 Tax=Stratiformator vulcanicus TaxID=2527980 RepID=A0A517R6F6_9PLAN|nr:3-deoxy-D-manno-octulosonic acid transferase [Stratiformator vulcanicus]QDT39487.1 3-deoxy-D-manno-octulosonic acid transferase [Stratiformator vulcanicus]